MPIRKSAGLGTLGYGRESRRFRPHLTLGRLRGGQRIGELAEWLHENANYDASSMTVREVLIFGSQPGRGGVEYHAFGARAAVGQPLSTAGEMTVALGK